MPGLLDILGSPQTAMAAGLLSPTPGGSFGQGLQAGITNALQTQRAQMREKLLQAEIMKAQQQAEQAAKIQAVRARVSTPVPGQQGSLVQIDPQAAARELWQAGDVEGAQAAMKIFQGPNIGAVSPNNFTPASVAQFQQTGNYNDLVQVPRTPLVQIGGSPQPMSLSDLSKMRDPQGNPPPPGTTLQQAQSQGYTLKSTAEQAQLTGTRGALAVIDELEGFAFAKENPAFTDFTGLGTGAKLGLQNAKDMANQLPEAQNKILYRDLASSSLSTIVRALGEKGTLAEGDVKRIRAALPRLGPIPDNATNARKKMQTLRKIINEVSGRPPGTHQKMVEVDGQIYVIGADNQIRPLLEDK